MGDKINPATGMQDAVAGPSTPTGNPIEVPADSRQRMQRAETELRRAIKAEKRVERFIPKIRPGNDIYVGISGVGMRVPFNQKVMVPESVAALLDVAVASHMAQENKDRG